MFGDLFAEAGDFAVWPALKGAGPGCEMRAEIRGLCQLGIEFSQLC